MSDTLLDTNEVATFVARGFLEFPGIVPDDLNDAAIDELRRILATWRSPDRPFAPASGDPWTDVYPPPSAVGAVLRLAAVRRIVDSLVGPEAVLVHDLVHLRPAGDRTFEPLHADDVNDPNRAFDIQILYFPHEVHPGAGGTGFVPGTHLRRVHETQVGRYRHVRGERQWAGPAGSVLVFHHGLWHRGMGNPSAVDRLMYEIRLHPTQPQVRRWDTGDHADRQSPPTLWHRESWMGEHDHRLELMARADLWRYLTTPARVDRT